MVLIDTSLKFTKSHQVVSSFVDFVDGVVVINNIIIDPFSTFDDLNIDSSIKLEENKCVSSY